MNECIEIRQMNREPAGFQPGGVATAEAQNMSPVLYWFLGGACGWT